VDARDKLLERLRRSPFGWNQNHLRRLYVAYGFEVLEGARHLIVRHPEHSDLVTTVARHGELAPAYARTAIRLVEEVMRRRGMMSEGGDRR
jgi:hypothetical protein